MKLVRKLFIAALVLIWLLPLAFFDFEKESVSDIDNRMLTEWDFSQSDITAMVDDYIKDRIGFRSEMITGYTLLNDTLFHEMVHPTYTYGKNDYVFFKMSDETVDETFLEAFVLQLLKVQTYCEERDIPFIYCINPAKTTVYSQYLPQGYHYQGKFLETFEQLLESYGIHYISNAELLIEKSKDEQVFDVQYDAGHWNDLGAFYGTNHILEKVSEYFPNVSPNTPDDFDISTRLQTSLKVSEFPIHEEVPYYEDKYADQIVELTEAYSGLKMDADYHSFRYLVNEAGEGLPRVLFFQGSYLNERHRFFESDFSEYYAVHNYENFLDFEYYFNIFQPYCVILETAEYATNSDYFDYDTMVETVYALPLDKEKARKLDVSFTEEKDGSLLTLTFDAEMDDRALYLETGGHVFDIMEDEDGSVFCTIDVKYYDPENVTVWIGD